MSWTPITGTADYSNGKTISFAPWQYVGTSMIDPFLNVSGTQDYGTYYQGNKGLTITPGTGVTNVSAPTVNPPGE